MSCNYSITRGEPLETSLEVEKGDEIEITYFYDDGTEDVERHLVNDEVTNLNFSRPTQKVTFKVIKKEVVVSERGKFSHLENLSICKVNEDFSNPENWERSKKANE